MQFLDRWSPRTTDFWVRLESWLKRWGAVVVAVLAIVYYSLYYRSGLNFSGEGGTVALVAMRLLEGQRPIVDTFLGYNVMWFYPVAWLFQLVGPDYTALRIYFFGLCTLTGVLAFLIVRRVTGSGWFSVLAALGPVLIPGMIFRNYMAFLAMLNMLVLLQAYVFEQPSKLRQIFWMAAAGISLGLTFLMRIDLGTFFTVMTAGLIVLFPLSRRQGVGPSLPLAAAGALLALMMFCLTHAPFYIDAVKRGYAEAFTAQYTNWFGMVRYLATQQLATRAPPPPPPTRTTIANTTSEPLAPSTQTAIPSTTSEPASPSTQTAAANTTTESPAAATKVRGDVDSDGYLQKRALSEVFEARTFYDRVFALATYLPILVALLIVPAAIALLLVALARGDFGLKTNALALLVTTGSALTLFPQYFFFRPDTPHLSEFMAPFVVAIACASWIASHWRKQSTAAAIYCGLVISVSLFNVAVFFFHAFPKESSGSIAARRMRKYKFVAENGVSVWLKQKECEDIAKMFEVLQTHTKPSDYIVCYPYAPTINFMTNRPSYEYNLYVDNAHNVSRFFRETLEEVQKYRPAAILIDNRALNQTEESRFRNWAPDTYQWIKSNYAYAGTFRRQEIYLRPDLYHEQAQ
jgi:hypothetical protein